MPKGALPSLEQLIRRHIRRRVSAALVLLIATVSLVTIVEGLLSVSTRIEKLRTRSKELQYLVISEVMVHNKEAVDAIISDANESHPNEFVEWMDATGSALTQADQIRWSWTGDWTLETPLRGLDNEDFGRFVFSGNLFTDDVLVSNFTSRVLLSMLFCMLLLLLLLPVAGRVPSNLLLHPMRRLLALVNPSEHLIEDEVGVPFKEARDLEIELVRLLKDRAEKQAEKIELEQSKAIAQAAQMLAHDIRRPFVLFKEIVDAMSESATLEDARTFASKSLPRVQVAFKSLDTMLDELLMVGNPRELSSERVSIAHVIDQAIAATIVPDSAVDHNTVVDIAGDLFVTGNDAHLERVVSNLLTNAIQAMGANDKLSIVAESKTSTVEIRVANTGSYISPVDQPEVFKLFYTKGKKSGSGLGLAICKRIVKDHGGSIAVESSREAGTTFIVSLPRRSLVGASSLEQGATPTDATKHLLVADDEAFYRDAVESLATKLPGSSDLEVVHAVSAEDALDIASARNFDAIIIDINFAQGSMDGISAVRLMRKKGVTAKIVVHSNDASLDMRNAAIRAGANVFAPKPMASDTIRTILV